MSMRYQLIVFWTLGLLLMIPQFIKAEDTSKDHKQYTVIKNIRYGKQRDDILPKDSSSDRLLDIYLPDKKSVHKSFPVFVFIHGGGFTGGDKSEKFGINPVCKAMLEKGFAVVSINYYLKMKYHKVKGISCESQMGTGIPIDKKFHPLIQESIDEASADAAKALKWLKKNAKKYHLDIQSVTLCGGSAGAITTLHTAYASQTIPIKIKAVINLWGAMANSELIHAPASPILTFHGDSDKIISVKYGYAIQQRMKEIGDTISTLHILKEKGHAQYTYVAQNYANEIVEFIKKRTK